MDAFFPDLQLRKAWLRLAERDAQGARAEFWKGLPRAPERSATGHKGTFGVGLAIGGSRGMSGSIALTGSACLFSGAGLTRLAVPDAILETVAQFQREYTTVPVECDGQGRLAFAAARALKEQISGATAVAVGPGLGRSPELDALVAELFFEIEKPAVFDADALNALSSSGVFSESYSFDRVPKGPRIFTPHPGEFARMSGEKPSADEADRIERAASFLQGLNRRIRASQAAKGVSAVCPMTLVLKGWRTVIAESAPDSDKISFSVNETGNNHLATGGSGDALTGVILGLLAQGSNAYDAARLGVMLHGLTAELRNTLSSRGGIASDVIRLLPCAFDYFLAAQGNLDTDGDL